MKHYFLRIITLLSLIALLLAAPATVLAQEPQPTATTAPPTAAPTNPPVEEGQVYSRPLLAVGWYGFGEPVIPGTEFTLTLSLDNLGESDATNIVITFEGGTDFIPKGTGGVIAVPFIDTDADQSVTQSFLAASSLLGNRVWILPVNVAYTDYTGAMYSEKFNLSIDLVQWSYSSSQPTVTPTPSGRAQLVVAGYEADVDPLQPGSLFNLQLNVRNLGIKNANAVSMILGGGSLPNDNGQGTPAPGGVSGGTGDLSVFAPIGQSNVVFMGDLPAGETKSIDNQLIVNVTAAPGAYPLKISFIYTDEKNQRIVEDQVITLLVFQLPQVDVNFYSDPGTFFVGQPQPLPIQVNNLGRKSAVLGNMRITTEGGELQNNVTLVGTLEPGGYFPLDAMFTPMQAGPVDLNITIAYTDDFNQPREITQTLTVQVEEGGLGMGPGMGPGIDPNTGMPIDPNTGLPIDPNTGQPIDPNTGMPGGVPGANDSQTLWQKIVRVVRGLLGLGSGSETPTDGMPEGIPSEQIPSEGKPGAPVREQAVPVGPKG